MSAASSSDIPAVYSHTRRYTEPPRVEMIESGLESDFSTSPASVQKTTWSDRLCDTFGVENPAAAKSLLYTLIQGLQTGGYKDVETINGALAMVHQIAPQSPEEAVLVVQLVIAHQQSILQLSMAAAIGYVPYTFERTRFALKFMDLTGKLTERLAKMRRGGQQTVRVEHVHVHSGGAAIVGNVSPKDEGRT